MEVQSEGPEHDAFTFIVILNACSVPGKANPGDLVSTRREVPSWGRLDPLQLGNIAQFAISRAQLRPRREAFIKSDLAFPQQLAGLLMPDSKCQLVRVSACKRTPAPLWGRGGVCNARASMGVASLSKPVAISYPCTHPIFLFISHIYRKPKHLSLGLAARAV